MTLTDASNSSVQSLSLSAMLKDAVVDADGKRLGKLQDVVVKLRAGQYPLFFGIILSAGEAQGFVPAGDVVSMDANSIQLRQWDS